MALDGVEVLQTVENPLDLAAPRQSVAYELRGEGARAVHSDELHERALVLRARDVEVPPVAVAGLADALDAGEHPEPQQQS